MQVPGNTPPPASTGADGRTRRDYLAGLAGAAVAGLAGCSFASGDRDGGESGLGPLGKQWERRIEDPARPTFGGDGLYLSGKHGYVGVDREVGVYALTADGSRRWRATTRDGNSAVGIGEDAVYVGSSDGGVYALDADDGTRRWRYRYGSGEGLVSGSWLRPATVGGVVVATVERAAGGSGEHAVVGLDAASGERLWRTRIVDNALTVPAVVDGAVAFGTDAGRVHAVEAATGDVRWQFEARDSVRGPAVRSGDALFVRSHDDHLYALGTDGIERWTAEFDNDLTAGPALGGSRGRGRGRRRRRGQVYAGSGDYTVRALETATGEERWRHEGRAPVTALAVGGETVYAGTDDGTVRAHATGSGEVDWSAETNGTGNPVDWLAARDGRLYVGDFSGVEAYGPVDGDSP